MAAGWPLQTISCEFVSACMCTPRPLICALKSGGVVSRGAHPEP